ncbi:MAG: CHASE domain-containing protein [Cyanobacteria bacterium P01_H01_bin.58]
MSSFLKYFSTGLVLTLGLGITLGSTAWVGRWERLSRQTEFQKQINNLTTALQRTTNRYTELLLSISDLYDAANNDVDEQIFRRFVQRAVSTYPGIQALEWAPEITHAERETYEQQLAIASQQKQTEVTERDNQTGKLIPAIVRDRYVPVTFVEPLQNNELALGYDLMSDETRRIALERARNTGAIAATGRIQLVQETADNQYSFLVFLPIYRQPAATLNTRREQVLGYILGVFRVADVVEESLNDLNYDINFHIFDKTAPTETQLLGVYDAQSQQVSSDPVLMPDRLTAQNTLCLVPADCIQFIQLGQREWQIVFSPSTPQPWLWGTLATLFIGLLITTTLLVYLSRWQSELQRTRELSDLKLRLFSMASHELRTPLSVITISAQSLQANRKSLSRQQQANTIDRIQIAAKRMGQLVNDILTLTRAEAGKLEFNPEIVAIEPFCQQLFDQANLQPGQTLYLEGNAVKTKAYLDKKLLHSILSNLLSNAAKYSPTGSEIRLEIKAIEKQLCFQVIDQGIGIPLDDQSGILSTFYRGHNVGQIPGTGLGLAVVRTCVELHGGMLKIDSEPEVGTRISVLLPWIE